MDPREAKFADVSCFSSSLSPQQVARIMTSSVANTNFALKTKLIGNPTSYCAGIVVRNLQSGEETLLTQPVFPKITDTFSSTWYHEYTDHPVFQDIDFKSTSMDLPNPLFNMDHLSTSCIIHTGRGKLLQVIAFLVYEKDFYLPDFPSKPTDHVILYIIPPSVPKNRNSFIHLPSPRQQRFYALQYGLLKLGKKAEGFLLRNTDPVIGPTDAVTTAMRQDYMGTDSVFTGAWETMYLKAAFSLPATEKTAGTNIIPKVLQKLNFLLPGVDSEQSVYYDILQSHKFAYTFRIRNLAGWKVVGAVNAVIPSFTTTYHIFSDFVSPYEKPLVMSQNILKLYPQTSEAAALSLATIDRLTADNNRKLVNTLTANGRDAAFIASFRDDPQTFTTEDLDKLSSEEWRDYRACMGLLLIRKYLMLNTSTISLTSVTNNNLLLRFIQAMQEKKDVKPFLKQDISDFILLVFDFCHGLASHIVNATTVEPGLPTRTASVDSGAVVSAQLTKMNPTLDRFTSLPPAKFLEILRACIGTPVTQWHFAFYSAGVLKTSRRLATFLLNYGNECATWYSLLYPLELFGMPSEDLGALISEGRRYHPRINTARRAYNAATGATTGADLINAVAYAMFSAQNNRFPP